METINKKVLQPFKILANELDKRGQMNGIISELTALIIKNLKEIEKNGEL
tara:strand:- start:2504 stop:2653 length:150 start_codon:yes stop_codon:yes gene_type:complete